MRASPSRARAAVKLRPPRKTKAPVHSCGPGLFTSLDFSRNTRPQAPPHSQTSHCSMFWPPLDKTADNARFFGHEGSSVAQERPSIWEPIFTFVKNNLLTWGYEKTPMDTAIRGPKPNKRRRTDTSHCSTFWPLGDAAAMRCPEGTYGHFLRQRTAQMAALKAKSRPKAPRGPLSRGYPKKSTTPEWV